MQLLLLVIEGVVLASLNGNPPMSVSANELAITSTIAIVYMRSYDSCLVSYFLFSSAYIHYSCFVMFIMLGGIVVCVLICPAAFLCGLHRSSGRHLPHRFFV